MNRRASIVARVLLVAVAVGIVGPRGLHAATLQDPGTLRIVVTAEDSGAPLAGALVSVPDLGIAVPTDQSGTAVIPNVRPGSYSLVVSSLGYDSFESSVELENASIALEVALSSTPIPLDPVVVEGRAVEDNPILQRSGFYERRAAGLGEFLDRADIEGQSLMMPSELFRLMPGVHLKAAGPNTWSDFALVGRRGFNGFRDSMVAPEDTGCRMQLFIDGMLHRTDIVTPRSSLSGPMETEFPGPVLDRLVPVEAIEAIEAYTSTTRLPPQFNVPGSQCGAILVWTVGFNVYTPVAGGTPLGVFEEVVRPGGDVRIVSELASGQYRVVAAGPNGVSLRSDATSAPIIVPSSAITGLEVSLGRSVSLRRGLLLGSVTGGVGSMIILATCNRPRFDEDECLGGASPAAGAAMSVALGAVAGLVVSLVSDEQWAPGRLPVGP